MKSDCFLAVLISLLFLATACNNQQDKAVAMYTPVPVLDPQGDIYKTLGPTDLSMYHSPIGKLRTALVFVDFPGFPAKDDAGKLAKELTANGKSEEWFKKQSFGKMTMEYVIPSSEWRTMSKSPDKYTSRTTKGHRDFIAEALNLYPETDFTKYEFVVIIPSIKKSMGFGTACFSEVKSRGCKTKHGRVNLGVTFGTSSFTPLTYYVLNHELGHALSLPDTYDVRVRGLKHRAVVGAWDLMCDTGNGANFIGWHRHKLGWIDESRKHFMKEKVFETTLTPLSEDDGLAMVVVPIDDAESPSKVFVVELALPIRKSGEEVAKDKPYGEGILVYSVDAKVPTGIRPLVIYPKSKEFSKVYSFTYKAPYLVGDTFTHEDAPMKVEVLEKDGKQYSIRITRQ
jgi:M6 family metalloprotease-like protein